MKEFDVVDTRSLIAKISEKKKGICDYMPPKTLGRPKGKLTMDACIKNVLSGFTKDIMGAGVPQFIGYSLLSTISQEALIRAGVETIADEATRKFIEFNFDDETGETHEEELNNIEKEFEKYRIREIFNDAFQKDGYFGGCLIYIDVGELSDEEKTEPLILDEKTFSKGMLKGFKVIEPVNIYPAEYNTSDPTDEHYFNPESWYILGKKYHASRFLYICSNPTALLLKPAYNFFGVPRAQMALDYVAHFVENRESAQELLNKFSLTCWQTDLSQMLQGGECNDLIKRVRMFNRLKDNQRTLVFDKEMEDVKQINTPLGGVTEIVNMSLNLLTAVWRIPKIKYIGEGEGGLNASSREQMRSYYDFILGYKEKTAKQPLKTVLDVIQLNMGKKPNDAIKIKFPVLWELDDVEKAKMNKTQADRDALYIANGVLSQEEVRKRLSIDKNSEYNMIDVDNLPEMEEPLKDLKEDMTDEEERIASDMALDEFIESEHPRDKDGKFVNKYDENVDFSKKDDVLKLSQKIHKLQKLNFKKIDPKELKTFKLTEIHKSSTYNKKGSEYYFAEKDGKYYFVRKSNHWGNFTTNIKEGDLESYFLKAAKEGYEAREDISDIFDRLGWKHHSWDLEGGGKRRKLSKSDLAYQKEYNPERYKNIVEKYNGYSDYIIYPSTWQIGIMEITPEIEQKIKQYYSDLNEYLPNEKKVKTIFDEKISFDMGVDGRWITIGGREKGENGEDDEGRKGRHIFLDDDETPEEAIEGLKDKDKKIEKSEKQGEKKPDEKSEEKKQNKNNSLIRKIDDDIKTKQSELNDIVIKMKKKRDDLIQSEEGYEELNFFERKRKWQEIEEKSYDFYKDDFSKIKYEIDDLKTKRQLEFNKIVDEKSKSLKNSIDGYNKTAKDVADKLYSLAGGEDNKKKIDEINKKINDLFSDFMKTKDDIAVYSERVMPYYEELKKLNSKTAENRLKNSEEISKIYKSIFNSGFKISVSKSQVPDFEKNVSSCLNGIISEDYSDLPDLTVNSLRGRAYFNPQFNSINISKNDNVLTQIHEYIHFVEDNNVDMLANSIAFLEYRTQGEKAYKMNKLTKSRSYGAEEISKKDNFFHAYCGKVYDLGGDYRKAKATELMSMGVERLFKDPVNFYEEDKEYFAFVLWNLTGGSK